LFRCFGSGRADETALYKALIPLKTLQKVEFWQEIA
jgi:hypothetical protein